MQFKLVQRFVKIIQRRCRNTVTAVTKINFIQIQGQNLVFGKGPFHSNRQNGFFDFSVQRQLIAEQKILCHLLGDG